MKLDFKFGLDQGLFMLLLVTPATAIGETNSLPEKMLSEQKEAIARLPELSGGWRGEGWTLQDGKKVQLKVLQRAGSALDGTLVLIETRSQANDGSHRFHSFNTIVFSARKHEYAMQAHGGGLYGEFPIRLTATGYIWDLQDNGNGLRYKATISNGVWTETTERISRGKSPVKISEMVLRRTHRSSWPGNLLKQR